MVSTHKHLIFSHIKKQKGSLSRVIQLPNNAVIDLTSFSPSAALPLKEQHYCCYPGGWLLHQQEQNPAFQLVNRRWKEINAKETCFLGTVLWNSFCWSPIQQLPFGAHWVQMRHAHLTKCLELQKDGENVCQRRLGLCMSINYNNNVT